MTPEPIKALAELRALSEQATPGPWKAASRHVDVPDDQWQQDDPGGLGWEIEPTESPNRGQFVKGADAHLAAALVNAFRADPAALLSLVPRDGIEATLKEHRLMGRLAFCVCGRWASYPEPTQTYEAHVADAILALLNRDTGSAELEPDRDVPVAPGLYREVRAFLGRPDVGGSAEPGEGPVE